MEIYGKGFGGNGKTTYEINNKNGNGAEYYDDSILKFEGEYLNGERKGKGKDYNEDGDLVFEGEYLYGERNENGKEYSYNGKIQFDGEYKNGKRNGQGKEYNSEGKLIFEGIFIYVKNVRGKNKYMINYILKANIYLIADSMEYFLIKMKIKLVN